MMRWFRSLFAWKLVRRAGIYDYWENSVTGARKAKRWNMGGWSPLDRAWLDRENETICKPPLGRGAGR